MIYDQDVLGKLVRFCAYLGVVDVLIDGFPIPILHMHVIKQNEKPSQIP